MSSNMYVGGGTTPNRVPYPCDNPKDKSPDDQAAEAMITISDVNALEEAIDRLYKNEHLRYQIIGYDDPPGQSSLGTALLQIQGALHVVKLRTLEDLKPLGDEAFTNGKT